MLAHSMTSFSGKAVVTTRIPERQLANTTDIEGGSRCRFRALRSLEEAWQGSGACSGVGMSKHAEHILALKLTPPKVWPS